MQLWNTGPLPRRKRQTIAPKRPPHSQPDLHLHGHKQASSAGSDTQGGEGGLPLEPAGEGAGKDRQQRGVWDTITPGPGHQRPPWVARSPGL